MFRDRRTLLFTAIFLIYILARVWRMADSCLWFDEIFSVHAAEHDWGSMFWFVAQDLIHPPLFYVLLKGWIAIGGESVFWLRLLPVIFSALVLIPLYLFCREMRFDDRVVGLALFLLAINGTFIKYAQLVRMYSLLMMLSLISLWLFARFFNRGKNLMALIIVNLVMINTHYYGWLVVGCEIMAVLIFQRFKWRGMAVMTAILGVLFLPWLWFVSKAAQSGSDLSQNISWIPRPGFAEIGTYIIDLTEPFYFQVSSEEPASYYFISIPLLLIFAAATALFITRFKTQSADEKRNVYFLTIFSILPIALVFFASSILPHSIWGTRHLIVVAAPLMLLAANILIKFDDGGLRITAITLIILFSSYAFVSHATRTTPVYVWCAWDGISNEISLNSPEKEKAKIYTFENLVAYHVWFATRNTGNVEVIAINGGDGIHDDNAYFLPRGFDDVRRLNMEAMNDDRAWLVFRTERIGDENGIFERVKNRGHELCPNTPARFGGTNVFSVEVVKPPEKCRP